MLLKNNVIKVLLLLCTVFSYGLVDSTTDKNKVLELNITEAIDMAVANNIDLKSKVIEQKGNEWKLYSVWNNFLPEISLTGNLVKSNLSEDDRKGTTLIQTTNIGVPGPVVPYEYTIPEWGASTSFSLTWTFNAAMVFGAYQTVLDYRKGQLTLDEAKRKLIKNVKQSYYGIMIQKEDLAIKRVELKAKEERYKQAVVNFKNGLIPKLLLLRSQVAYESILPQIKDKENNYKNNVDLFKFLLGIEDGVDIVFKDPFSGVKRSVPDKDKVKDMFEKNNITLRNLYISKGMVQSGCNSYISALTPSFQLGFTANPTFKKDPAKDAWFEDVENDWKDSSGMLRLSIILPISEWIPFSKNQVNIIGSNYAIKKMDLDIKNYIDSSKLQINSSIDKIDSAIKTIETTKLSVMVADEAYNLAKQEFRLGTKELLDLQDTENDLLNMKLSQLYSEYEYINNMIELEYLLNTDIEDILNSK